MPKFVCKNTFISLRDGDEKHSTRSLFRSKSEEPSPRPDNIDVVDETAVLQLVRLNSFFSDSTDAVCGVSDDFISTETLTTPSVQDESDVVQELRELQEKLRKALVRSAQPEARSGPPVRLNTTILAKDVLSHCREGSIYSTSLTSDASARKTQLPTTIMIRNLPKTHTQLDLISELERLGFAGTFDFVHIPLGKDITVNHGYAFVNFIHHSVAAQCTEALQGFTFQCKEGSRAWSASVDVAHLQGLGQNMQYFETAAVNSSKKIERRPVVVANLSKLIA